MLYCNQTLNPHERVEFGLEITLKHARCDGIRLTSGYQELSEARDFCTVESCKTPLLYV